MDKGEGGPCSKPVEGNEVYKENENPGPVRIHQGNWGYFHVLRPVFCEALSNPSAVLGYSPIPRKSGVGRVEYGTQGGLSLESGECALTTVPHQE